MQSQDISYTQRICFKSARSQSRHWFGGCLGVLEQECGHSAAMDLLTVQSLSISNGKSVLMTISVLFQALYEMEWTSDERPCSSLHVREDCTSPSSILLQAGDLPSAILTRPWSERSSAPLLPPFDLVPALRWSYSYPSHVLMICCLAMFSSIVGVTHHCSLTYSTVECTV